MSTVKPNHAHRQLAAIIARNGYTRRADKAQLAALISELMDAVERGQ